MIDVGVATLVLATTTTLAIIVPVVNDAVRRRADTAGAMYQLFQILLFFNNRVLNLNRWPEWDASNLLVGLDAAMMRVLSGDMSRSLPWDIRLTATLGVFASHDVLTRAQFAQALAASANADGKLSDVAAAAIKTDSQWALDGLRHAIDGILVVAKARRYKNFPAPSEGSLTEDGHGPDGWTVHDPTKESAPAPPPPEMNERIV